MFMVIQLCCHGVSEKVAITKATNDFMHPGLHWLFWCWQPAHPQPMPTLDTDSWQTWSLGLSIPKGTKTAP